MPPMLLAEILELRAFESTYHAMKHAEGMDDRKTFQRLVDTDLGGLIFNWDADVDIPEEYDA